MYSIKEVSGSQYYSAKRHHAQSLDRAVKADTLEDAEILLKKARRYEPCVEWEMNKCNAK